jgi:glycosyltransferase involved in cell wall biosynthesis
MKILAGIPTRLRNTSGRIAEVLAQVCDTVLVVSQEATCFSSLQNVIIHEKDVNFGLVAARNYILDYAAHNNFDLVIQSDDDLKYTPEVVEAMIKEIVDNPTLGAIASSSRAYFNWDKALEPNKNFVLSPCSPQLWAARTEVLQEVGPWSLEYLEDREHGARMWKLGYAIASLHISMELTHNPFIARTSSISGGQDKETRYDRLGEAIRTMNQLHGDIVALNQAPKGAGNRTFSSRYKWSEMIKFPVEKFGYALGYTDSRGRRL